MRRLFAVLAVCIVVGLAGGRALSQDTRMEGGRPESQPTTPPTPEPAPADPKLNERIGKLIAQLGDDDFDVREQATVTLIEMWKDESVLKRVERALAETETAQNAEVSTRCAVIADRIRCSMAFGEKLLGELGIKSALDLPGAEEEKKLRLVRRWMADPAEFGLAGAPVHAYMAEMAAEQEQVVAKSLIACIRRQGLKNCAATLAGFLRCADHGVRGEAELALGALGARQYAEDIAKLLTDMHGGVRGHAACALAELGAGEYAERIARLLTDPDAYTRECGAESLGLLGAKEYTDDVLPLVKDANDRTAQAARKALRRFGVSVDATGTTGDDLIDVK